MLIKRVITVASAVQFSGQEMKAEIKLDIANRLSDFELVSILELWDHGSLINTSFLDTMNCSKQAAIS